MTKIVNAALGSLLAVALVAAVVGCNAGQQPAKEKRGAGEKAPAAKTDVAEDQAEIEAELAKLAPEDREAAKRQKICPVTDQPLGSMGVPVKITVKGTTVFLCCDGCEDDLKADPDKFLAKLKR